MNYLKAVPVYDVRHIDWFANKNECSYLLPRPLGGYVSFHGDTHRNLKKHAFVAEQLAALSPMVSTDDTTIGKLLKDMSCALAYRAAVTKRNAKVYNNLNVGDDFAILNTVSWLKDGDSRNFYVASKVKSPLKSKASQHELWHTKKGNLSPQLYSFTNENADRIVLTMPQYQEFLDAVNAAAKKSEMVLKDFLELSQFVLLVQFRLWSLFDTAELSMFDYTSNTWSVTDSKSKTVITGVVGDMMDLKIQVKKAVSTFERVTIVPSAVKVNKGIISDVTYVNEAFHAAYTVLAKPFK